MSSKYNRLAMLRDGSIPAVERARYALDFHFDAIDMAAMWKKFAVLSRASGSRSRALVRSDCARYAGAIRRAKIFKLEHARLTVAAVLGA